MRMILRAPAWRVQWLWAMFWLTRKLYGTQRAWEWLQEEVRK